MDNLIELKSIVQPMLMGDECEWRIIPYKASWMKRLPVFCIIDKCGHSIVFAKDKNAWIRVSGGGNFSGMNNVLKDYKLSKDSLRDMKPLVKFLETFYELYHSPEGIVLSPQIIESYGDDFSGWLYLDRNVEDLKAMCSAPVVTIDDDFFTIQFNVLNKMGAIELWNLKGKHIDDHVSINQLTKRVLKPIGTYFYPSIG